MWSAKLSALKRAQKSSGTIKSTQNSSFPQKSAQKSTLMSTFGSSESMCFLVFLKSLVFCVVSVVLWVRCYLHLRWYYNHSIAFSDHTHRIKPEYYFQDTDWGEVWTEHKVQNFLQGQLSSFEVA